MFADDTVICSESGEQVEESLDRCRYDLRRRNEGQKIKWDLTYSYKIVSSSLDMLVNHRNIVKYNYHLTEYSFAVVTCEARFPNQNIVVDSRGFIQTS